MISRIVLKKFRWRWPRWPNLLPLERVVVKEALLPRREQMDRPPDESAKALYWDYEMGEHYKGLLEHPAWKNLCAQMHVVRDAHESTWLSGEGDQVAAREGVKAIDALLSTPHTMIMWGEESEKDLRRINAERNGANG